MIRTSIRLTAWTAAALAFATALDPQAGAVARAQAQPGSFSLPPPSPTPTPPPQGPADERAGVVIPPRSAPAARSTPQPPVTQEPVPIATERSPPRPAPAKTTSNTGAGAPPTIAETGPEIGPEPEAEDVTNPSPDLLPPLTRDAGPSPGTDAATDWAADAQAILPEGLVLPAWWPWAAGGLAALALLLGGWLVRLALRLVRAPKTLRLAPPPPETAVAELAVTLPRLDLSLDVTGATRSLMMFTLAYRLTLANRSDTAVSDLGVAVQIACARRGNSNGAAAGTAQRLTRIERIGPQQSRSITSEVQLPLASIAVLRQGSAAMFIPLVHVTLEGEGQTALVRSFVVGTPSTASALRLHPIQLDTVPGSISGLRAQPVEIPEAVAAA